MADDERAADVGAIYLALMEAPPSAEEGSTWIDLSECPACAGIPPDRLAMALAAQDEDTLSAVAGRPVARLASNPTGIAL